MNFFAHLDVARRSAQAGPEHHLGAVLPDLLAMARVRADPSRLPAAVAAGRALHHRADAHFHRHDGFRELVSQLRRALSSGGVPMGAARGGAHLGTELLLDGSLPDREALGEAFRRAAALAPAVMPALDPRDHARWLGLAARASRIEPSDYESAQRVAVLLVQVLGRRPRLALGPEHLAVVAEALERQRPAVVRASRALVDDVATALAAERGVTCR